VLRDRSPLFEEMYAKDGRPSIPPERLLKAKMLQALYTIRSENLLIEALEYNLLFRWFLDLSLMDSIWDNSTFSKNQERLLQHQTAQLFFTRIVELAKEQGWVSDEHFTVDATLIDAWASRSRRIPPTATRATPAWTSTGRSAAMPLTRAPPTGRPNWFARAAEKKLGCALDSMR
jgi:transposase